MARDAELPNKLRPGVVAGQADGAEGRKRLARTALHNGDGRLCAAARSIRLRIQ
jgi:hypothetical protein